jgi:PAS domain S-box-containing protein
MMDPGSPSPSDIREFSRRVREKAKRHERLQTSPTDSNEIEMLAAIEDLRIAEEELRAQNEELVASRQAIDRERARYRELFDFAPDAYIVTDANGTIRDANVAAGQLFGVEPRFLVGKPLQTYFEEGSRAQYRKQLDQLCHSDSINGWELWVNPRGGQRMPVAVSLARAPTHDQSTVAYRWILRNISRQKAAEDTLRELNRDLELRVASRTAQLAAANLKKDQLIFSERKAREEAEIANRVKSEFLALLSHEFRTPLQAIFGYTELLEREIHGPLNEAQLRDLKRIQQSQQHLLGLITTILDFARLESGQGIEVEFAPLVMNDVLRGMEGFIGPQLETKQLSYSYKCEDRNLAVNADAAKVEQIVLNLLANAIKFTPVGGTITLECVAEGNRVNVVVHDSGIGIPPDKLEAIFEPFVQIRARGAAMTGTGLGLPISRRLATAMGGVLYATSEPGNGSTFTLALPAISIDASQPPPPRRSLVRRN